MVYTVLSLMYLTLVLGGANVNIWVEPASCKEMYLKSIGILGGVMLFGWTLMKMTSPSREDIIKV